MSDAARGDSKICDKAASAFEQVWEAGAEATKRLDIAADFLLATLIPKLTVREVDSVSFVTAYTWRQPLKEYQIKALKILKKHLPQDFVTAAGGNLASVVERLYGRSGFCAVVPVPCGHSKRADCLSLRLALDLAERLGASVVPALASPLLKGSSHPQQSKRWPSPRVKREIRGKVLLVDDVCTTGRHMSQSLQVLRKAGMDVIGLAWIGSR